MGFPRHLCRLCLACPGGVSPTKLQEQVGEGAQAERLGSQGFPWPLGREASESFPSSQGGSEGPRL